MNEDKQALRDFGGKARLFPLPNVVLFPQVVVPLHVFEPRYRAMTANALESDRLIAVVLLRPGWESDYEGNPAIHSIGCLGRIAAEQQRPDGRYDLLLRGLSRVRFGEEQGTEHGFRIAQAKLIADDPLPDIDTAMRLRRELAERLLPRFESSPALAQLSELFKGDLPLGALCDVLGFALPLAQEDKQELLESLDVTERAQRLMVHVDAMSSAAVAAGDRKFPPDFSSN